MIGTLKPAGIIGYKSRPDITSIAKYYSFDPGRLTRLLKELESASHPQLMLLQNPDTEAPIGAAVFMSSVWSRSYAKLGNPYGKVHRDFHYQCLFAGMAFLAEAGCTKLRVENPLSGYAWEKDAFICLLEAHDNIRRYMNPKISLDLQERTFDESIICDINQTRSTYKFEKHRPVGINPHVHDGLNRRTIFVEKKEAALRATMPSPTSSIK